jgi:hypothetical protein
VAQEYSDRSISSVSGGILLVSTWIRPASNGHHESDLAVIKATSTTITCTFRNGGTGYVTVAEAYGF